MKAPVFLSASIPDRPPYLGRCDPLVVREAVLALVSVTVRDRLLVFGGHPAISPLVEQAARSLGATEHVHIYQSRWFERRVTPEAAAFENLHWTDKGPNRAASLRLLRQTMIESAPFSAGVFIGGMEGVIDECKMFRELCPTAQVLPVGSTGGAAAQLWESARAMDVRTREALRSGHRYRALFRGLLS